MDKYFWGRFRVYDEYGYFVNCFDTEKAALECIAYNKSEKWFLKP